LWVKGGADNRLRALGTTHAHTVGYARRCDEEQGEIECTRLRGTERSRPSRACHPRESASRFHAGKPGLFETLNPSSVSVYLVLSILVSPGSFCRICTTHSMPIWPANPAEALCDRDPVARATLGNLEIRNQDFRFQVSGYGFRVLGLGFPDSRFGFRVSSLDLCDRNPVALASLGNLRRHLGFRVSDVGFGCEWIRFLVSGLEFRVLGSGFRVSGSGLRVPGSVFGDLGFGFRLSGSEFLFLGFDFRESRAPDSAFRVEGGWLCLCWVGWPFSS